MDNSLKKDRMLSVMVSVLCVSQTEVIANQGSEARGHPAMSKEVKSLRIMGENYGSHGKSCVFQPDVSMSTLRSKRRPQQGLEHGCALPTLSLEFFLCRLCRE